MPPKTRDVPTDETNDAAATPVEVPTEPQPSSEAEATGGRKLIRTAHRGDRFVISPDLEITGTFVEYPANKAKEIIELARVNGVRIAVADVEKG